MGSCVSAPMVPLAPNCALGTGPIGYAPGGGAAPHLPAPYTPDDDRSTLEPSVPSMHCCCAPPFFALPCFLPCAAGALAAAPTLYTACSCSMLLSACGPSALSGRRL